MKVVVTGGAGFIGSAVVRRLLRDPGISVVTLDKLTYAGSLARLEFAMRHPNHRFARVDICDRVEIAELFESFDPDAVIHLAAETHVDRSIDRADAFVQTNILGSYNLLEAARSSWSRLPDKRRAGFRFLHVSTDEVYGSLGATGRFTEASPYDPSSPYSASKAASDHLAVAWARTYGLPVLIANCCNAFGPYQFPEKLIPLAILNGLEGKPIPVYGDGLQVRDWLYVDDAASALCAILAGGLPGESVNVGARCERRNIDVVHAICRVLDAARPTSAPHERLIRFVADRPGHDRRYALDPAKLEATLGWSAQESFETGLEKTVAWYVENEAWWRPLRDQIYAGERLGLLPEHGAP